MEKRMARNEVAKKAAGEETELMIADIQLRGGNKMVKRFQGSKKGRKFKTAVGKGFAIGFVDKKKLKKKLGSEAAESTSKNFARRYKKSKPGLPKILKTK